MRAKMKVCGTILAGAVVFYAASLGLAQPTTQPAASPTTRPGKLYRIKIGRPEKVGQKSRFVASQKIVADAVPWAEPPKPEKLAFEIEALREVLATDANGLATKVAYTLDKCVVTEKGKRTVAAAKGTIAIASLVNGQWRVRCKDPRAVVSLEGMKALQQVVGFLPVPVMPDDFIRQLGLDKPRRLGESWPVDSNSVLNKAFPDVNVQGRMALLGLTKVDGIECLDFRVDLTGRPVKEKTTDDLALEKIGFSIRSKLPVDETLPALMTYVKVDFTMVLWSEFLGTAGGKGKLGGVGQMIFKLTPLNRGQMPKTATAPLYWSNDFRPSHFPNRLGGLDRTDSHGKLWSH